ncbi:MAG: sugar ABC transporter ATP-binding protein [Devosia nanyangense]|uniref:Sugar ABC transporter ATP-binding protein n=1 Tax=Devosia nanyangense TaxID=1228055 RepID=A0A933P014_9HYPH|nr:sugar ABC transporter ATP-binding protein [Devosia nanyangense]
MDSTQSIVEMRSVRKTFGSTRALQGVDFTVKRGEVHALVGRNGAGKSTLVSTLSGLTPADAGTITIADTTIEANGKNYAASIRDVIAHVQQTPQLFNLLTVAENLFLESPSVRGRFGVVSSRAMLQRTNELLGKWNMEIRPNSLAGELGAGARQLLEIMKALKRGVPVMILDEPTAALSNAERRLLFEQVKTLKAAGVSFVYISHHLDEIFEVADTVTIMRDGRVVKTHEPVDALDVETIADLMMGEKTVRSVRVDYMDNAASVLLEAKGIRIDQFSDEDIDFHVRAGEIVALAGPVGGGKEALAMILAGQQKPARGTISSPGSSSPRIGLVPTDRHASGYVGILGVRENVAIGGLDILSGPLGLIKTAKEQVHVGGLTRQTNVIASSLEQAVSQLSGGNQQKVVFARALCRDPQVLVALSPTRGVDVGAKEQLYALLRDLASKGLGVVVVSDEEDEIEQLANRVVIVLGGQIRDELVGKYTMNDLVLRMEGVI